MVCSQAYGAVALVVQHTMVGVPIISLETRILKISICYIFDAIDAMVQQQSATKTSTGQWCSGAEALVVKHTIVGVPIISLFMSPVTKMLTYEFASSSIERFEAPVHQCTKAQPSLWWWCSSIGGAAYNGGRAYYIIHYRASPPYVTDYLSKLSSFGLEYVFYCILSF